METVDVQVVYEQHDDFDLRNGPFGGGRVGVRFDDRIIWLGSWCSHSSSKGYDKAEQLAKLIADAVTKFQHPNGTWPA